MPVEWRATFRDIVLRFVNRDYRLAALSETTWDSSIVLWIEDRWEVLIDLCTESEGISDLVPHAFVSEDEFGYAFERYMVYVP